MKLLRLIANGANSMAGSYVNPRVYERPSNDGFIQDSINLRSDVMNVGKDMRSAINKHGQSYRTASKK